MEMAVRPVAVLAGAVTTEDGKWSLVAAAVGRLFVCLSALLTGLQIFALCLRV